MRIPVLLGFTFWEGSDRQEPRQISKFPAVLESDKHYEEQ